MTFKWQWKNEISYAGSGAIAWNWMENQAHKLQRIPFSSLKLMRYEITALKAFLEKLQ